jgi:hypothetical protein
VTAISEAIAQLSARGPTHDLFVPGEAARERVRLNGMPPVESIEPRLRELNRLNRAQ